MNADLTNTTSSLVSPTVQHYNMVMAAAAAASASDDHELLLNRFLPYSTSSSSQLFLDQSGASSATSLTAPTNGASNSGSTSSLVSSSSLRDTHSTHSSSHSSHTHPGVVASRSSTEAAVAAIYGGIPDVISLD